MKIIFPKITELFFERPRELRERHGALYEELRSFYCQDPASWKDVGGAASGA